MSDLKTARRAQIVFSLRHLLAWTALIAVGFAFTLAYRKNDQLNKQRDELISLSSKLRVTDQEKLASAELPRVADDFTSWQVYIPKGDSYQLRLGIGSFSDDGVPPVDGNIVLTPGQHRVTLYTGDSPSEEFRYAVYLDGKLCFEKTMGKDWMPHGWSSASGSEWPSKLMLSPAPLQLTSQLYTPNYDFGQNNYYNASGGYNVSRLGYRLWIDQSERGYPIDSLFVGFAEDSRFDGTGLRDGLRFQTIYGGSQLGFTAPFLESTRTLVVLEPEFITKEGSRLQIDDAWGIKFESSDSLAAKSSHDEAESTRIARVQANADTSPVLEMKWDTSKPFQVGLRLADVPTLEKIDRWRLRVLDGTEHGWRELNTEEGLWKSIEQISETQDNLEELTAGKSVRKSSIRFSDNSSNSHVLQWRAKEILPLQILERSNSNFSGMRLFEGLPVTFGFQLPNSMNPECSVSIRETLQESGNIAFPGGPVIESIEIELDATHDWIWLEAQRRKHP